MANVLDYLRWRGDLLLRKDCFGEVDAMILARLSYLPFDGIVPSDFRQGISLKQAAEFFLNQDGCEDLEFLATLREGARFCGMELSGYVNQVDVKHQKQFCAVTIKIEEQTYFVSYRGTDNTLVGWKEDFNMAFLTPIPSQQSAGEYFMEAADCLPGRFLLGGHSKGGNLAVYAAAVCGSASANQGRSGLGVAFHQSSHWPQKSKCCCPVDSKSPC